MNHIVLKRTSKPPPPDIPEVLMKAKQAYAEWCTMFAHLPKPIRCGIGDKIEHCFLEMFECIFLGWYAAGERKRVLILKATERLDVLKLFLMTAWENKTISTGFYSSLIEKLYEVGRMLYRWRIYSEEKTPPRTEEKNK